MHKLARLAAAYDAMAIPPVHENVRMPTATSVARINEMLQFRLPETLIEFAAASTACSNWLAGLGEDYAAPTHILQINKAANKIRRRALADAGKWEAVKPKHFIAFNLGFDQDYNCFDTQCQQAQTPTQTSEYTIRYWCPPRIIGARSYASFYDYMFDQINNWAVHNKRSTGAAALKILSEN